MNKKFVFLMLSMKTGGGLRVCIEIANILAELQYSVEILYPNSLQESNHFYIHPSILLTKVGKETGSKIGKLINFVKTVRVLKRMRNVVIIYTDPIVVIEVFLTLFNIKNTYKFMQSDDYMIYDHHEAFKNKILLRIHKWLTLWAYHKKHTRFLFNSQYTYDCFIATSKRKDVSCKLIQPAINQQVFSPKQTSIQTKEVLTIALIGRNHPLKGLQYFVKAWALVNRECKAKASVTIISHEPSDQFDPAHFHCIKPTSDAQIADILRQADIFISTSFSEGFGLPPLEAMACGCAVIVSDSGGVNEFARPNENCLMYPPKDYTQLARCIEKLLTDDVLRARLMHHAIHTAQKFSWERTTVQFLTHVQ